MTKLLNWRVTIANGLLDLSAQKLLSKRDTSIHMVGGSADSEELEKMTTGYSFLSAHEILRISLLELTTLNYTAICCIITLQPTAAHIHDRGSIGLQWT